MTDRRSPPDKHYSDPEIIPPGHSDHDPLWPQDSIEQRGRHRIYVTRVSPLGFLPFALLSGLVAIAVLVFLFGFFLILIPVAGLVLAAAIIANLLRGSSRWPR